MQESRRQPAESLPKIDLFRLIFRVPLVKMLLKFKIRKLLDFSDESLLFKEKNYLQISF